jgi:Rod binding domain-containing protein
MNVSAVTAQAAHTLASLAAAGNTKALANLPQDQQIKAVAGQFEAIMLRQFLKDSVSGLMGGESGGAGGGVYGYFLTDVLATKLADAGGLGLGRMLRQQLTPRSATTAATARHEKSPAQHPTP